MALFPVAGAKIYIGGQKSDQAADFTASDFTSESWLEIDGWEQMGTLGDAAQLISTDLINRGRTVKQKGTFNAGSMQNVFAILPGDSGQTALLGAATIRENYAFKVEFEDGSIRYFIALVMNQEEAGGNANTIQMLNITLEVNSNIVKA